MIPIRAISATLAAALLLALTACAAPPEPARIVCCDDGSQTWCDYAPGINCDGGKRP